MSKENNTEKKEKSSIKLILLFSVLVMTSVIWFKEQKFYLIILKYNFIEIHSSNLLEKQSKTNENIQLIKTYKNTNLNKINYIGSNKIKYINRSKMSKPDVAQ